MPPLWETAKDLMGSGFETDQCRRDERAKSTITNENPVSDPNQGVMGIELSRREWSSHICTESSSNDARMATTRKPSIIICDCGDERQTVNHIIAE